MAKMTSREMKALIDNARRLVHETGAEAWRHYKGGIYSVTGYSIDTDTGLVRVRYERIGGPDFDANTERGIEFSRPFAEWFEVVTDMSTDDGHLTVKRFTPVFKAQVWRAEGEEKS